LPAPITRTACPGAATRLPAPSAPPRSGSARPAPAPR
jgi:hypothetical protein